MRSAAKRHQEKVAMKAAIEEIERQKKEFCPVCAARMERQTIAVMLTALHNAYGFGAKRLRNVFECACGLGELIHENGDIYDEFVMMMKDKYGIDLEAQDGTE